MIDSNIAIYVLGNAATPSALRIARHPIGSVVTSAIVLAEVMRGVSPGDLRARAAVGALFQHVPVLSFDAGAAEEDARLPFKRNRFDRLIAAHALSLGLTLITNNAADFADIAGLRVENWTL